MSSTCGFLANPDFEENTVSKIYPNPTKDFISQENVAEFSLQSIAIYDILGQLVVAIPNAEKTTTIDVCN